MKYISILLLTIATFISVNTFAQANDESLIRKLEDAERTAILKNDTIALSVLMSKDVIVQNPENVIVGFRQIIDRVKQGKISYTRFERMIDKVSFIDDIAVVMGTEVIVPQGASLNAGKTVTRKFTNIWKRKRKDWKLVARQATNISIQ